MDVQSETSDSYRRAVSLPPRLSIVIPSQSPHKSPRITPEYAPALEETLEGQVTRLVLVELIASSPTFFGKKG